MNVSILKKNFNNLGVEMKVFLTLVLCADKNGAINVKTVDLAKYLNVSRQTISKHVKTFCTCGILKFKYSGKGIINPDFYFAGDVNSIDDARQRYEKLTSDF